jgi:uncharacterized RDD family membrane protein YckC
MKSCDYCGGENPDEAINCSGCGTELKNLNPPPIISKQDKLTAAGFGIRALARIIDAVFGLFIGFVAGSLGGMILVLLNAAGVLSAGWQQRIHGFSLTVLGFSLLGNILYHCFCEGIYGATLGKLCCGIRVVSEDGSPSNLKGALIRTLAYYFDALFFGLVGYNSMQKSALNQRYGDVWGKTAVLKASEVAPESERTPMRLALSLFLGIGCWIFMVAAGLVLKVF